MFDGNVSGRRLWRVGRQDRRPGRRGCPHGADGLALQAESDVGVDVGGDADVGVAQQFLDHNEIDTLFQGGAVEII